MPQCRVEEEIETFGRGNTAPAIPGIENSAIGSRVIPIGQEKIKTQRPFQPSIKLSRDRRVEPVAKARRFALEESAVFECCGSRRAQANTKTGAKDSPPKRTTSIRGRVLRVKQYRKPLGAQPSQSCPPDPEARPTPGVCRDNPADSSSPCSSSGISSSEISGPSYSRRLCEARTPATAINGNAAFTLGFL
jgi:hypothetical protein